MREFSFHDAAKAELIGAARYYEARSEGLGKNFLAKVRREIDTIRQFSNSAPQVRGTLRCKTVNSRTEGRYILMAFSDYKSISQVQAEFQIKYQEDNFVFHKAYEPSKVFLAEFEFNQQNMDMFASEAARCEIVIFPILREVYKNYYRKTSLWIQRQISFDEKLNGTPDYIVSRKSELGKTMLEYPLLIIAEAKKNDFEQGWAQCLSELVAAKNINQSEESVYGIVTDGKLWEFGKLDSNIFTKNIDSFIVSELSKLFGALNFIFDIAS